MELSLKKSELGVPWRNFTRVLCELETHTFCKAPVRRTQARDDCEGSGPSQERRRLAPRATPTWLAKLPALSRDTSTLHPRSYKIPKERERERDSSAPTALQNPPHESQIRCDTQEPSDEAEPSLTVAFASVTFLKKESNAQFDETWSLVSPRGGDPRCAQRSETS